MSTPKANLETLPRGLQAALVLGLVALLAFPFFGTDFYTQMVARMMILAISMAPASVLQPFNYTSLPWSILLSIVIFHETIDAISLLGATVIVGAGLVVMARERIKRVPPASAEPALPGKE